MNTNKSTGLTRSKYTITTLPNGLRVVCSRRDGRVSYIGAVVNAGSADEGKDHEGLAHFVEHTIFKGTSKRRAWQISARMEVVGGEINAYTSKEETMVYTNAPAAYEERAVELLYDLIGSSVFPSNEIDKEREVIIEEIYSYLDSPSDRVYDEFEELAFRGSGLSHNILGTPDSVKALTSRDCLDFIKNFYVPEEMVVYCVTPLDDDKMLRIVEKYFNRLESRKSLIHRLSTPPLLPFDEHRDNGTHQANTIMGTRVFGRGDARRYALFLLNNYLAGPCMNSLLNRELREKRGYVYTVEGNVSLLGDTGLLTVYFGCDPANVAKCRKIIGRIADDICSRTFNDMAFEKIKRQYCGQLIGSSDHIESRSMALGKSVLYYGRCHDISHTAQRIMEVSPSQFRDIAEFVFANPLSVLTLT